MGSKGSHPDEPRIKGSALHLQNHRKFIVSEKEFLKNKKREKERLKPLSCSG
jgi:hypothetical protein